jgi:hypothetical protein
MSDAMDERRRALEDMYFQKQEQEALARLKSKDENGTKALLSPVSGKPMNQVTLSGVIIDVCPESGGVWLDKGELEQLLQNARSEHGASWTSRFLNGLIGKRS